MSTESKSVKWSVKRPFQAECFSCYNSLEVKFNPGQGKYVEKNHWYYWTKKEENRNKYICDNCLVNLYRNSKWNYRENITDLGRRQVLRTYIYDGTLKSNNNDNSN